MNAKKKRELKDEKGIKFLPKHKYKKNAIFSKTNGHCFYCGKKLQLRKRNAKDYMTKDHLNPKANGGSNYISNLVPSCKSCNTLKGNLSYIEFINKIIGRRIKAKKRLYKRICKKYGGLPFTTA